MARSSKVVAAVVRRFSFRWMAVGAMLSAQLAMIGCDPGMLIRQVNVPSEMPAVSPATGAPLLVRVETAHQLVGEIFYLTAVWLSNNSSSALSIRRIELEARGKTYANEFPLPPNLGAYPVTVEAGKTVRLELRFRIDDSVWKTFFRQRAELLIQYESSGDSSEEKTARATIVGTHLDGSR